MPLADIRIERLTSRIQQLHNQAKPKQVDDEAVWLDDRLYLYGTDYMSNDDLKIYLLRYPEVEIKWINDSSCTLQFKSADECADAFRVLSMKPVE